ncbi:tRNA (adenosine(37)-N6)-threonylcarbamoyltransferase complex transferase subunit TsaD [Aquibacillus koreensis]|uniref:tRNA N6-adenosine threonylcarbamoyltransferase n=1 Tax=Aquibacillus koreensis TaxID=279446 RepID=A0A9X3WMW5_9BACI|nr:tRNA (adenosine(37)-N6)-threonylcarbamoyltransferase complex transferase subunit TsaD [Aquibacillus koreensis]MCT2536696.1 tRNA (adenosine(37)-N6)-threonylcarbamoyltransferase complex transferase subunit TsaD [Aquibacillus koreensis]MDC3421548.1 tRNA (adenosine(37)-N6)-threonylcarbamoyltransferase complex transferase subunit TsaD [Aquibacillus koreensis]
MKKDQYIIAIETSCDETAVAIVKNGTEVISNVVASQIESHKRFGGVVPEIASRHHVEQMTVVLEEAFEQAGLTIKDMDAITVTEGPGLVGALLVGVNTAKTLAFANNKPIIGVHHIAGHIYANRLEKEFNFPLLALVVSGGHTELILMKEHGSFEIIGETRDDAAGEAYDKVARTLQLPYPGGPMIDKLAAEGKETIDFPRAWLEDDSYDFSFSGLKSAVINKLHNAEQRNEELKKEDIAASFQASVVEVLSEKTYRAAMEHNVKQVIVAGGVAANRGLRQALEDKFKETSMELLIPPLHLCTDNAAMIAAAGSIAFEQGHRAGLDLNANPSLSLEVYSDRKK